MDCGKCRASGQALTRGKDGRGRHGREQARYQESRQSSADAPNPVHEGPGTPHMTVSPWARKSPQIPQEKSWSTPTRRKADDAWIVEHERRMSDLDEQASKMTLKPTSRRSRRTTPRESYERVIEVSELVEEPEEIDVLPSQPRSVNLLPYEIEEASKTHSHRRSRKVSHDSEGSMPYYQEMPLIKTPRRKTHHVPPVSEHNPHEYQDVRRSPRHAVAKTEPYYPQSCSFEPSLVASPPHYGGWMHQYEAVQPMYRDPYYPRSHQVY